MEFLVKQRATMHRGGYYSHGKQFIKSLPIFLINFDNPNEARIHKDIVDGVRNMMALSGQKKIARIQQHKETLDRAIAAASTRIEAMLDSLYGVSVERLVNI
jgi:hypothetical protein